MKDYNAMTAAEHRLEVMGREHLTVTGVEDVERFDENTIVLSTSRGAMTISGDNLHIEKLSLEGGELHVEGTVTALIYGMEPRESGGLLRRLLGV